MATRLLTGILFSLKSFVRPVALVIVIITCSVTASYATHLVGGSMTYKYLGKSSKTGYYNYLIRIEMYRDCSNGNMIQFSTYIVPGVYERSGASDTPRVHYYNTIGDSTDQPIYKIDEFAVSPPAAAKSCAFAPSTCISEGIYEDIISLSASSYGYYVYFATCCRNTMVNVPGVTAGQDYFAIIPPTSTVNSTPEFNAVPSPYICVNDTVSLLYSASEPDGDSLAYTLSQPYGGGSTGGGVSSPTTWPGKLPVIPYNSGYSPGKPFGSKGYVNLDKTSGILTMFATLTGRYALAVDVHEYRKGVQISVTRRDVQIIVISCPYRLAPKRIAISDSLPLDKGTPTVYSIEEGQRIAFNLEYQADSTGVSVFSETGFFDKPNNLTHQPVFTYSLNGDYATAHFSWQTTCKDASASPYTFTLTVADTGCPPKTTYQGFQIFVNPFTGVKNIYGPSPACQEVASNIYSATGAASGDTLIWKIIGGAYKNGPNDSSVTVNWGNSTVGTVDAVMHSQYGCGEDTFAKKITINPKPVLPVISGPKITCSDFPTVYNAAGGSNSSFFWKIGGGSVTNISNQTKTALVEWPKADSASYVSMYERDPYGCFSDTAILKVIVVQPEADSIYGSLSVCPNSNGIDYWVTPQPGATYHWSITGGRQVSGGNGPQISVDWGAKGGGIIKLNEITSQGCVGDTVMLNVRKDYVLYTSAIAGDTSSCEYLKNVPYSVTKNSGSTYSWQISGGSIASGNGNANILVDWDSAGPGALMVTETAYDSVNNRPCTGIPVSLSVNIHSRPVLSPISGPAIFCENDTVKFSVAAAQGSAYVWKVNGTTYPNQASTLFFRDTALINPADTLHISVIEKSINGCESAEQDTTAVVYKLPVTGDISGPSVVCAPGLNNVAYQVNGFPTSTYNWTVTGGTIISGDKTNKISVNWLRAGYGSLQVQEVNQIGCAGPVKYLAIKIDSFYLNMQLVTTEESNDKVIELSWIPENNLFFAGYYKVYREREGQNYFNLVDSLGEMHNYLEDKNVNTALYAYRYQVVATNSCGAPVASDIHRSIRLSTSFDGDSSIYSSWNPYEGWPVSQYDINTGINEDTSLAVYGFTQDTSYTVVKTLEGYKQCVRIKAKESGPGSYVSWSNKVCMDFDPVVWIPDIFTPHNGDNINNTFRIFVGNYSSFSLDIYNRWGEHIFSSGNPSLQWDGTYKGIDCVEGVYLYMVTVNGAKENIYRSGTVELER